MSITSSFICGLLRESSGTKPSSMRSIAVKSCHLNQSIHTVLTMTTKVDMKGKTCVKCKKGKYNETSIQDDMHGVLHCDKCGHETKRWAITAAK